MSHSGLWQIVFQGGEYDGHQIELSDDVIPSGLSI